jgi:hypothetical protein
MFLGVLASLVCGCTVARADVPPGATAAPACTGDSGPVPLSKSIAVCGTTFPAWDTAYLLAGIGATGFWVSASSETESSALSSIVMLDAAGNTVARTFATEEGTSIFPYGEGTHALAYNESLVPGELLLGRYDVAGDFAPVFQHKLLLDTERAQVTNDLAGRFIVTEDKNDTIEVVVFATNGAVEWARTYSSAAFGFSSPTPFDTQTSYTERLADGSYAIEVVKQSIDLGTFAITTTTHIVKLSATGTVEWAKTFTGLTGSVNTAEYANGSLSFSIAEANFSDPAATPTAVVGRLAANGTVLWSKRLTGARLVPVGPLPGDRLLLTGSVGTIENPFSSTALAVLSSNGTLEAQTQFDAGTYTVGYPSVREGAVYMSLLANDSEDGPLVDGGASYIGVGDATLSGFQWKQHAQLSHWTFLAPDDDTDRVAVSVFDQTSHTLHAYLLDATLGGAGACDRFVSASVTTSAPGITVEDVTVTPSDIVVTSAAFTPTVQAGALGFESFTTREVAICAAGGGGGGGGGGEEVVLSASSVDIVAAGGTGSIGVTTTSAYSISSDAAWLTFGGDAQRTGSSTIAYTVAPNLDPAPTGANPRRTAVLTVGDKTFTVTQAYLAAPVQATPSGAPTNLGTSAGSGHVDVLATTGTEWRVVSSPWIETETTTNPDGSTRISWDVSNPQPIGARSGSVRIVDAEGDTIYTLPISQAGAGGVAPTNMSARTLVGTGDKILIPGFVVGGSGQTRVMIRGVGHTLGAFIGNGTLDDPRFLVYRSVPPVNGVPQPDVFVGQNDSWEDDRDRIAAYADELGAFPLTDARDAARVFALDPGAYTIHFSSASGASGIGLVELYELDASDNRGLVNLSARAEVGADDLVMIPGFAVQGDEPVQVLVRGVGPTIGSFGVQGFLADPEIEVFDSDNVSIGGNDDWGTNADLAALQQATAAAGAFDLLADSKDAAILLTLPPGTYTAHIRGKGADVGVALLEVYFLRDL